VSGKPESKILLSCAWVRKKHKFYSHPLPLRINKFIVDYFDNDKSLNLLSCTWRTMNHWRHCHGAREHWITTFTVTHSCNIGSLILLSRIHVLKESWNSNFIVTFWHKLVPLILLSDVWRILHRWLYCEAFRAHWISNFTVAFTNTTESLILQSCVWKPLNRLVSVIHTSRTLNS